MKHSKQAQIDNAQQFKSTFLRHYLASGLGSLSKSDFDALVMHLIENFGTDALQPTKELSNYEASIALKLPVSKVKLLRYSAALKFSTDSEAAAKKHVLIAIQNSSVEINNQGYEVKLLIENSLAKNWLQAKLKAAGKSFDFSFNSEMIRVSAQDIIPLIENLFTAHKTEVSALTEMLKKAKNHETKDAIKKHVIAAISSFATSILSSSAMLMVT